ncbi:sigma-70 family RNA polymerase sigma factor [Streptomyces sp. CFMR 7]|uniref:sigma-70 family RNA polymerase sigma factor n=1 Tax=Streptomyces sp. CFMR 7 TaxID=1649184 RepID=UPI0021B66DF2|nr:sigma-70 family RNA polymerase sigma factor [Streptomyces sp. CFMR 7]
MYGARQNDGQITDWALAAGCGDREAADRFVRATYEDVRRFVAYLSADVPGADDLAQETYVRAMSGLARFAGRSCARTWLLSIARRVVIDRHRTAAVRPRTADTADWQGAAERAQPRHLPGFDESVAVFDALRHLDPARRQAFVLTQVVGLSYEEAADAAGCPVGTVRSRVARARRELAGQWRTEPGERGAPGGPVSAPAPASSRALASAPAASRAAASRTAVSASGGSGTVASAPAVPVTAVPAGV